MKTNNTIFGIVSIVLAALFVVGCIPTTPNDTISPDNPALDTDGSTPVGVSAIGSSNNKFAFDMYRKLSNGDNLFFSPISISTALAMAAEGANGTTADEMSRTLYLQENSSERHANFAALLSSINGKDKNCTLSMSNALWVQDSYKLLTSYTGSMKRYYAGNAVNLDFRMDSEGSRKTINSWVEDKTNDKIKDLIPFGGITPATRLVITNAIYFKGKWLESFDPDMTQDSDFWLAPGTSVRTKMMHSEVEEFRYYADDDLEALEMPYLGNELSMLIILPKNASLDSLRAGLDAERLEEIQDNSFSTQVIAEIPKFRLETSYGLGDELSALGMKTAFSDVADFSGISEDALSGKEGLKIDEVVHKAFVDVSEEGTEAAAATALIMTGITSVGPTPEPILFKADHPFTFMILHKPSGSILFMGDLANPAN